MALEQNLMRHKKLVLYQNHKKSFNSLLYIPVWQGDKQGVQQSVLSVKPEQTHLLSTELHSLSLVLLWPTIQTHW